MKTIRFLIAALLVATTVSAQNTRDDYQPVVYLLGVQRTTVNDDAMNDAEYCKRNQMAIDRAVLDFVETHRGGFEQRVNIVIDKFQNEIVSGICNGEIFREHLVEAFVFTILGRGV